MNSENGHQLETHLRGVGVVRQTSNVDLSLSVASHLYQVQVGSGGLASGLGECLVEANPQRLSGRDPVAVV